MPRIIEYEKVKNLNEFIGKLSESGYIVEHGPHVVLEDHSELSTIKVSRDDKFVAYIIAHYITQYYRAVLDNSYSNDQSFMEKLLELKYSSEKWSIPVNPLYIVVFDEELLSFLNIYDDTYPVEDGENLVKEYRSRNPHYKSIPRIAVARIIE
jgi:hypothetical protein